MHGARRLWPINVNLIFNTLRLHLYVYILLYYYYYYYYYYYIFLLQYYIFSVEVIITIIIKTSTTRPSGKNKIVYKLHSQPHKHLRLGKVTKTLLSEVIASWLHPLSHPAFRCQTQLREGHSTFEPGPARSTLQIGTFYTLIVQTQMDGLRLQLGYVELW